MDVYCSCGKYMGVILAGSNLRKEFGVICNECHYEFISMKREKNSIKRPHSSYDKDKPFGDIFNDIFGKGK